MLRSWRRPGTTQTRRPKQGLHKFNAIAKRTNSTNRWNCLGKMA
jgi:hypothetical protein